MIYMERINDTNKENFSDENNQPAALPLMVFAARVILTFGGKGLLVTARVRTQISRIPCPSFTEVNTFSHPIVTFAEKKQQYVQMYMF